MAGGFGLTPGDGGTLECMSRDGHPFALRCCRSKSDFSIVIRNSAGIILRRCGSSSSRVVSQRVSRPAPQLVGRAVGCLSGGNGEVTPSVKRGIVAKVVCRAGHQIFPKCLLARAPSGTSSHVGRDGIPKAIQAVGCRNNVNTAVGCARVSSSNATVTSVCCNKTGVNGSVVLRPFNRKATRLEFINKVAVPLRGCFNGRAQAVGCICGHLNS